MMSTAVFRGPVLALIIAAVISFLIVPGGERRDGDGVQISAQGAGICDRTERIQAVILRNLEDEGIEDCALVTDAHLATIERLIVVFPTGLALGDLDGLTGMRNLTLSTARVRLTFQPGSLRGLSSLETVTIINAREGIDLPPGFFDGLPALYDIDITSSPISTIETGTFNDLPALLEISLADNGIETIQPGAFNETPRLEQLFLHQNRLAYLPDDLFDGLQNLRIFNVRDNDLTEISEGMFDGMTSLTAIRLTRNELASLPHRLFADLPSLNEVDLEGNKIVRLPPDLFDGSNNLVTIRLGRNHIIELPEGVFDGLRKLDELDLGTNLIPALPEAIFRSLVSLRTLRISCNPVTPTLDEDSVKDIVPGSNLETVALTPLGGRCEEITGVVIPALPGSTSRIVRLEPTIRSVNVTIGEQVRLAVNVYGRQDLPDNELVDGISLDWQDGQSGGSFTGDGWRVLYTPPENAGTYTVTTRIRPAICFGDDEQCRATFEVIVDDRPTLREEMASPENPPGPIPELLTDESGAAYESATPVEGGRFGGDGYSIMLPAGSVPNGEFIGIDMQVGDSASNAGQTHHRYTLAGSYYTVNAIDASLSALNGYRLNSPAEVCVPLPAELRANVDSLVIVSSDGDLLTVLNSRVLVRDNGELTLCGALSVLPAQLAAARHGQPEAIEVEEPIVEPPAPPTTGGWTFPRWVVIFALFSGMLLTTTTLRRRMPFTHPRFPSGGSRSNL